MTDHICTACRKAQLEPVTVRDERVEACPKCGAVRATQAQFKRMDARKAAP